MSKPTKLLPIVMLSVAAAQSAVAAVPINAPAVAGGAGTIPVLLQYAQDPADYAEPDTLTRFSRSLVERLDVAMMPVGCEDDYDCYEKICGTGTFCPAGNSGTIVDDTDAAC